jgi:hypothetical protein
LLARTAVPGSQQPGVPEKTGQAVEYPKGSGWGFWRTWKGLHLEGWAVGFVVTGDMVVGKRVSGELVVGEVGA